MAILKAALAGLVSLTILGAFQNCSEVNFATVDMQSCSDDPLHSCHLATEAIQKIQPAVAVRGISCLMCHAEIRANIITDFGHGDSWYFGGSTASVNDASWFNNYVNTWQSARSVIGAAIVPDQLVPESIQRSVPEFASLAPMKIKDFMSTPYTARNSWSNNSALEGQVEMTYKFAPEQGEKVISASQISITSPAESEIEGLATELWQVSTPSAFKRVGSDAAVQLAVVSINGGTYLTNLENQALDCNSGNIVVKGTLFLKNLRVAANKGCKLYVSGTVFIEGPITYTEADLQSLQITSSNGIFMGIDLSNLRNRLINDSRGLKLSGARSYEDRAAQVLREAQVIGVLRDATASGGRQSINYSGLLLNAPMIHSRYLGIFKGVIVAESALFALGQFHFEFDAVYKSVNVFPLLKKPILAVK